jgi:hypothetical protein
MKPMSAMLETVIFEIFEKMFFLFPEKADAPVATGSDWLTYTIAISGPPNCSIRCHYPRPLARLMASNYIGSDDADLSDETVSETCKEALNVIAGHLINQLGEEYQLGIPEAVPASAVLADGATASGERLFFAIAEQPFLVVLDIRE